MHATLGSKQVANLARTCGQAKGCGPDATTAERHEVAQVQILEGLLPAAAHGGPDVVRRKVSLLQRHLHRAANTTTGASSQPYAIR